MGIVTVTGFFPDFEGSFEVDGDRLRAHGSAKTATINTRSEKRDEHLRAADFFDAENHPEITFESTGFSPLGEDRIRVAGDLTIKGITKPVEFDATIHGTTDDPWGNERVGVEAVAEIDRRDFDLNWDVKTPGGVPLASYKVKIQLHLGAVKAA
jgi:polyisoprenoid-binding protein YceI